MFNNVVRLVEILGVYDGWCFAELDDGTVVNRWSSKDDPTKPEPGYERRWKAVERHLGDRERRPLSALEPAKPKE